jgi:hypothetical protein
MMEGAGPSSLFRGPLLCAEEVMGMQRYLLVLDTDLPVTRKELDQGPISLLAARHAQEPSEVVVLSLAATGPARSSLDLLLGTAITLHMPVPAKYPIASRPDRDVNAAAERRMILVVQRLKEIGCRASGIISDHDVLEAVRAESRAHRYDQVILVTSRQGGTWLALLLHRDPIHKLRRRWRQQLTVFPLE